MAKVIGLTGGIGSGKSTVAKMFENLGVPVYIADERAKLLMDTSAEIKQQLIALFGDSAYTVQGLDRAFIASKIFSNKELLTKMNAIVHPKVGEDFNDWLTQQKTPYIIKEAAIIFENNQQAYYDYIITVTSPVNERIKRVVKRDKKSEEQIKAIVNNQLTDEEKIKLSDFVIVNKRLDDTRKKVVKLHKKLLKLIESV